MKLEEVIWAYREGKKIRRKAWADSCTMPPVVIQTDDKCFLENDWEIVKQPEYPAVFTGQIIYEDHWSNIFRCRDFNKWLKQFSVWKRYKVTVEEIE